jgi:DNA-binding response OmpR family regulator
MNRSAPRAPWRTDKGLYVAYAPVTGHAPACHSKGVLDAGCDAFVTKPCLPEDLLTQIQRMLSGVKSKGRSKTGKA